MLFKKINLRKKLLIMIILLLFLLFSLLGCPPLDMAFLVNSEIKRNIFLRSSSFCNDQLLQNNSIEEILKTDHSHIYIKLPTKILMENNNFTIQNEFWYRNIFPLVFRFQNQIVNPNKKDFNNYEVSSRALERKFLKLESDEINFNCLFFALGQEYRFPIRSGVGLFSIQFINSFHADLSSDELISRRRDKIISHFQNQKFRPGYTYNIEIIVTKESWYSLSESNINFQIIEMNLNQKFTFDEQLDP